MEVAEYAAFIRWFRGALEELVAELDELTELRGHTMSKVQHVDAEMLRSALAKAADNAEVSAKIADMMSMKYLEMQFKRDPNPVQVYERALHYFKGRYSELEEATRG